MADNINFPRLMLPFTQKTKEWRKNCLLWANQRTFFNYEPVRKSVMLKKINYDLLNGKLHMNDMMKVINPDDIQSIFTTNKIPHYPIINSKLNVLRGEELKRPDEFTVIVTNPNAISEIENNKKMEIAQQLQLLIENQELDEETYTAEVEKLNDFFMYEWQDLREIRANELIKHYKKELNIPFIFNNGYMDALTVGEEIYQCDIVSGEPVIHKVNPLKLRIFKSGYSNRIEDADMIIMEDYWSPGKIIDTYYDSLSKKDMKYIEDLPTNVGQSSTDSLGNIDERMGFINGSMIDDTLSTSSLSNVDVDNLFTGNTFNNLLPYDLAGNIRVLKLFWKSKRKILKVKSYNPETGEELFDFLPENHVIDKDAGEEATTYWINEAWEGVMIGEEIFINMQPRKVLYNTITNPSRCHFGIVGSVYNLNEGKPFSLVDMMKPYNYLYNVTHDRLNKALASNWGSILEMDLSKVPRGWDVEKWMYYARVNHIAVTDSFNEGQRGASTGKLAGGMNNASKGIIETNIGNYIQQLVQLLEFLKNEMSEVGGISKQREGQISNRETVGGVERATLQSSHITEWIFATHEDVKKRTYECFLETAKIALKGTNKKFPYIMSDNSRKIMDIDGDEFAESDYGLILDNSDDTAQLKQQIDSLAQAALLNQKLSFSAIMKLYSTMSVAEKQRLIEKDELNIQLQQQQAQEQQLLAQQLIAEMQQLMKQAELELKEQANIRDNETKILIAQISKSLENNIELTDNENHKKLLELVREFDARLKLDREKLELEKTKVKNDLDIKRKQLSKQTNKE